MPPSLMQRIHIVLMAILVAVLTISLPASGKAQEEKDSWADPVNLSKSGGASHPVLISDPAGKLHAFWFDQFSGYQYTSGDGFQWETPRAFEMPFEEPEELSGSVQLSDPSGILYWVWIDQNNQLFYTSTRFNFLERSSSLPAPIMLSGRVKDFDASIDENGKLHVIYLLGLDQGEDIAGVYYIQVMAGKGILSKESLEQSPYYRSIRRTENEPNETEVLAPGVAIQVVQTGEEINILAAWSNPLTKKLLFTRSLDGGRNWGEPISLLAPSQGTGISPDAPSFMKTGDLLFLFWNNTSDGLSCETNFLFSSDSGETWSSRERLFEDLNECSQTSYLLNENGDHPILFSIFFGEVYLAPLDETTWGNPRHQADLPGFVNSDTFQPIQMQPQQAVYVEDNILVIGDEPSESGDIWVSSSPAAPLFEEKEPAITWSAPQTITSSMNEFQSLTLLADAENRLHAIWSQPKNSFSSSPGMSIGYLSWGEPEKMAPELILTGESGKTNFPSAVIDPFGRILITWSGGKSGDIYFSWAAAERASSAQDWFPPQLLPSPRPAALQPAIKIATGDMIHVAFLIPINENRGVYITRSADRGKTWSSPQVVYDAESQGCEMVDQLSFTTGIGGTLQLAWVCSTIPGGIGTLTFHSALSMDGGKSWFAMGKPLERPVEKGKVIGSLRGQTHRIWHESSNGQSIIWDQVWDEARAEWSVPLDVLSIDGVIGPWGLAADPAGQVYLMAGTRLVEQIVIKTWIYQENNWAPVADIVLDDVELDALGELSLVVLPRGELAALYTVKRSDPADIRMVELIYRSIPVAIPAVQEKIPPQTSNTILVVTTPTATAPVGLTPESEEDMGQAIDPNTLAKEPDPQPAGDSTKGLVAVLSVILIMVGSTAYYHLIWRNRSI